MYIATITMKIVIKVINVLPHSNHYHGKHFQGIIRYLVYRTQYLENITMAKHKLPQKWFPHLSSKSVRHLDQW